MQLFREDSIFVFFFAAISRRSGFLRKPLKTHTPHQLERPRIARKPSWPVWAFWRRIRPAPGTALRDPPFKLGRFHFENLGTAATSLYLCSPELLINNATTRRKKCNSNCRRCAMPFPSFKMNLVEDQQAQTHRGTATPNACMAADLRET